MTEKYLTEEKIKEHINSFLKTMVDLQENGILLVWEAEEILNMLENKDNRIKELEKELKERKSYNKGAKEALRVSEELEKFYNEEASRLETELEGKDKMIEDMAEWIYSNISLCKMSEIAMLAGYDIKKFIMGISDEEAKSIIKRYFEKKEG